MMFLSDSSSGVSFGFSGPFGSSGSAWGGLFGFTLGGGAGFRAERREGRSAGSPPPQPLTGHDQNTSMQTTAITVAIRCPDISVPSSLGRLLGGWKAASSASALYHLLFCCFVCFVLVVGLYYSNMPPSEKRESPFFGRNTILHGGVKR